MKKPLLTFVIILLSGLSATSQLTLKKLILAEVPRDCEYQGDFVDAYTWKDSLGINYLVRSHEYAETKSPEGASLHSGYVFIYHYYLRKTGDYFLRLGIIDFEKNCRHSMTVQHLEKSITLTDLDKDGYGEITLMYLVDCKRREGPTMMKLLFMEDGRKFALRGLSAREYMDNDYEPTDDFYRYPEFLKYCSEFWERHNILPD